MQSVLDFVWSNWRRLGGAAGIVFIVMFVVGFVIEGEAPDYTEPAGEIKAWFVDNDDQWLVGDYIIGLSVLLFFLPFLVALRSYLGVAEGGRAGWSRFAFAAGIIFIVYTGAASTFLNAAAVGAAEMDEGVVQALATLNFYAFSTAPLVAAPFFFASAVVILRTGAPWTALGWLGLALAVVAAVAGAAPIDGDPEGALSVLGFITLIGLLVWVALLSIGMIVKEPAVSAN